VFTGDWIKIGSHCDVDSFPRRQTSIDRSQKMFHISILRSRSTDDDDETDDDCLREKRKKVDVLPIYFNLVLSQSRNQI
jgi:hypothetical protein